ncbi:hypothetical protein Tco_1221881, partial [Tanacetum coccineum]
MKTKNRSVKRKLPYDSEVECSTTGVSKKQNFDPFDMFAHDSGTNVDNRGSKIPLNMHPLHGDSSSIEISLTQTVDSLAHEQQHGTIDIPSQPVIVGLTSTLSGTCASAATGVYSIDLSTTSFLQQFPLNKGNIPFTPDAIPSPSAKTLMQTHIQQSQPHHQQQCLSDTKPEGIPNPKNICPRSETPNQSRTIIPDVYRKKSSHLCANNRPLLQMFTDKETKQLRTNNRRMRPKQPQPRFQRPRSSYTKPARICDPKSIRPRYETVTERHPACFISKKPIYLIGESFRGCLALAVAAQNPTVDLVTILANPC